MTVQALAARLHTLLPDAVPFRFGVDPDLDPGGALIDLTVEVPDAAFTDLPDGTARPGPDLAARLEPLGWTPDAGRGHPVDDDVPEITISAPTAGSPALLHDLGALTVAAFAAAPPDAREHEVPLT